MTGRRSSHRPQFRAGHVFGDPATEGRAVAGREFAAVPSAGAGAGWLPEDANARPVRPVPPVASGRSRSPAFRPLRTDVTEPGGVGRRRACCGDAEHGECGEDFANSAVVHGPVPRGLLVTPLDVGAIPSRPQYRFLRIGIGKSNRANAEEPVALPWRRGGAAFPHSSWCRLAGTSMPGRHGRGQADTGTATAAAPASVAPLSVAEPADAPGQGPAGGMPAAYSGSRSAAMLSATRTADSRTESCARCAYRAVVSTWV